MGDPWISLCTDIGVDAFTIESLASTPKYFVSTGSNLLDLALGGGLPSGRFIELYSWEGEGKTTMCHHAGASAQMQGGFYVILDAEASVDRCWAEKIGVNANRFICGKVRSIEQGFSLAEKAILKIASYPDILTQAANMADTEELAESYLMEAELVKNAPIVVAWDSLAATPTEDELNDKEFGSGMASRSRKIRRGLRKLVGLVSDYNVIFILVNHLIQKLNVKFGSQETTIGGGSPRFMASARLRLRKTGKFVIQGRQHGIYIRADVEKSKLSPPGYKCTFPLAYDCGIDRDYEAFDYLFNCEKYVTKTSKKSTWYQIQGFDESISLRYSDLRSYIDRYPKLRSFLYSKVTEVFSGIDNVLGVGDKNIDNMGDGVE